MNLRCKCFHLCHFSYTLLCLLDFKIHHVMIASLQMAVDPVLWLFPELQHVSATSLWFKLTVISASFVFFLILFILCYISSHFLVKSFSEKLRLKEKYFWCTSFGALVLGFFAMFNTVWFLFVEDALTNDVANGSTFTSYVVLYIGVGHFLFDTVILIISNIHCHFFNYMVFFHHISCIITLNIPVVYNGKCMLFAIMGLMLEVSVPSTYLSWIMLKCGMAHLRIWKVNQFVVVHIFHCRTNLTFYAYYKVISQWENLLQNVPYELILMGLVQLHLLLLVINPHFTHKYTAWIFESVDQNHREIVNGSAVEMGTAVAHTSSTTNTDNSMTKNKKDL